MARATLVPHQHEPLAADFITIFKPSTEFGPVQIGSDASGSRVYRAQDSAQHFLQTVTSTIPCIRFDAVAAYCSAFWTVPDDLHTGSSVNARVWWSTETTTAAQTATWIVTYGLVAEGAAVGDASTALNTVIVADTDDTDAHGLNITASGVINAASLTNGRTLNLKVELDAVSGLVAATDNILFYGVEIDYTRRFL